MTPLTIPPAAQADGQSVQMLSAWIAKQGLHCTLNVGMWDGQGQDEPAAWGILLADVIRQIANAVREAKGSDADDTMEAIVDSLLSELNEPTAAPSAVFAAGRS